MDGERNKTGAPARKPGVVTKVVGGALVIAGIPLLVLPGPGLLLIAAGLGMLGWRRAGQRRAAHQATTNEDRQGGPRI